MKVATLFLMWLRSVNYEQISAVLSRLVTFVGGYFVARGWITDDLLVLISSAVVAVGAVGWSVWKNRPSGVILAASSMPQVAQITLNEKEAPMAARMPENVVTR